MSKYEILKFFENALTAVEDVLGVKTTSNIQINKLCFDLIPEFIGTFSSNNIPRMKNDQCSLELFRYHEQPHAMGLRVHEKGFVFYHSIVCLNHVIRHHHQ